MNHTGRLSQSRGNMKETVQGGIQVKNAARDGTVRLRGAAVDVRGVMPVKALSVKNMKESEHVPGNLCGKNSAAVIQSGKDMNRVLKGHGNKDSKMFAVSCSKKWEFVSKPKKNCLVPSKPKEMRQIPSKSKENCPVPSKQHDKHQVQPKPKEERHIPSKQKEICPVPSKPEDQHLVSSKPEVVKEGTEFINGIPNPYYYAPEWLVQLIGLDKRGIQNQFERWVKEVPNHVLRFYVACPSKMSVQTGGLVPVRFVADVQHMAMDAVREFYPCC